jgi:hypothetical protein
MIWYPQKVMGECFGGRRTLGKLRGRWHNAVWRDATDLFQIRKWKAAASNREEAGGRGSGSPWL